MKKQEFLSRVEEELKKYELDNYYDLLTQAMDNINSLSYEDITINPKVYVEELLKKNEIEPKVKIEKKQVKNAKMGIFASLLFIVIAIAMLFNFNYLVDIEVVQVICIVTLCFIVLGAFINLVKGYSTVYTFTSITTLLIIGVILGQNTVVLILVIMILVFGIINLFESIRYRMTQKRKTPIDLSNYTKAEMLEIKMNFGARNLNLTDNIRYLKLKSNFGKVHVNATSISDDLLIDVRGSFGQIVLDLPENARVIDNCSISFGTSKHGTENGDGPTIIIAGKFRFGTIEY